MGDFLTPKAISNRLKSIGLQKLRCYCQMCQKQCRDENGFKCHTACEGHLRQMKLFSEKSNSIIDSFSHDFQKGYLETLCHRHGTKRVLANRVYQEYIADKHHIHMNSTIWSSLTAFCLYLGKEGKAVVDETERGWFIQYIDRDPKALARQLQREERVQMELDEQERMNQMIQAQIIAANKAKSKSNSSGDGDENDDDDSNNSNQQQRQDGSAKAHVEINMKLSSSSASSSSTSGANDRKRVVSSVFESAYFDDENEENQLKKKRPNTNTTASSSSSSSSTTNNRSTAKLSNIDQMMLEEENMKRYKILRKYNDKTDRKDHWLVEGIVVKIKNKKLKDGKYYSRKGTVARVVDTYVGEISLVDDDGDDKEVVIRIDQEQCETVIPKINGRVLIVNGCGRGCTAVIIKIEEEKYTCDVAVERFEKTGGLVLKSVDYEDVCKLATT